MIELKRLRTPIWTGTSSTDGPRFSSAGITSTRCPIVPGASSATSSPCACTTATRHRWRTRNFACKTSANSRSSSSSIASSRSAVYSGRASAGSLAPCACSRRPNTASARSATSYYLAYSDNRFRLIEHLHSQQHKDLHAAIRIAQKILDRIIFVAFCEDRGLLPENCIDEAYKTVPPFTKVTNPRWRNFLDLFHAIDRGHERPGPEDRLQRRPLQARSRGGRPPTGRLLDHLLPDRRRLRLQRRGERRCAGPPVRALGRGAGTAAAAGLLGARASGNGAEPAMPKFARAQAPRDLLHPARVHPVHRPARRRRPGRSAPGGSTQSPQVNRGGPRYR